MFYDEIVRDTYCMPAVVSYNRKEAIDLKLCIPVYSDR